MITIQQQVSIIKPVYNDDFFVVTSTNYTQPNFQYVCDIYVNGNYITRTKTFPHPTNFSGKFAVKRIVESYLSKDFDLATSSNLGLQIVRTLTENELKGVLKLQSTDSGTQANLRFPL